MDRLLRFIGVVRSEIRDRKQMPALGAPAAVELDSEYADGLLRVEKHSHMWVLAWLMDRGERDVLQVTPRGVEKNQPHSQHGVFAVRSPARPNPVGLTAAHLLRVDGLRLEFDSLDFVDGTPVLDVKPYFVSRDMIYSAASHPIGKPKSRDALRESLLMQALRYVPERHPDVALAVRVMEHYRAVVTSFREPAEWELLLPLNRPYFIDAMAGMTRVRQTRGLQLGDDTVICGSRYTALNPAATFEETMTRADEDLFHY